jgi:carbon storage regulator CsrA
MLVLSRKVDERILIGDDIVLTITKVGKKVVKVGIEAPDDIKILREELIKDKVKSLIDKNKK